MTATLQSTARRRAMKTPRIRALLALMAFALALAPRLWSAPSEVVAPQAVDGSDAPVRSSSEKLRDWLSGDYLTGDWGGGRTWLKEHGITIKPRLTQFVQSMTSGKRTAGSDESGFQYGDKADILVNADLSKLGFWKGLSATVHAEYNFGENVNGNGGTLSIPNTALFFRATDKTSFLTCRASTCSNSLVSRHRWSSVRSIC